MNVLQASLLVVCVVGCGEVASADRRSDAGTTIKDAAVRTEAAARVDAPPRLAPTLAPLQTAALSDVTAYGGQSMHDLAAGVRVRFRPQHRVRHPDVLRLRCVGDRARAVRCGLRKDKLRNLPGTFSEMLQRATCTGNEECYYPRHAAGAWLHHAQGLAAPRPTRGAVIVPCLPTLAAPSRDRGSARHALRASRTSSAITLTFAVELVPGGVWQLSNAGCGK